MNFLKAEFIKYPAYIYNEKYILNNLDNLLKINSKCNHIFSIKAFSVLNGLELFSIYGDGFSVSSFFEAKLARDILGNEKMIHFTSPGLRPDEIEKVTDLCDYISFNSLSQWERFHEKVSDIVSCGLRVNTQLTFVKDKRYNPCRKHSKLGVPLDKLASISNNGNTTLRGLKGILFHTNCESTNFNHLLKTVKHLDAHIPRLLEQIEWVNMGGGYIFDESRSLDKFTEAVTFLKDKYNVEVFIEPGKGIVGKAGYLVSSVIDIFESDGKNIAVLDTTVNHMPEVFEYQFKPDIMQESENGKYKYILAGSTCLAGDLFGEYRFDEPLELGSRIVFENMGAYTLVKANMFNGINLPSIYVYTKDGKLELVKKFGYEDFLSRCGVKNNVSA
jgi:carboxynorspermidine decarboxylase